MDRLFEKEVTERARILETIFSNTHLMIAHMDAHFNFILVNEAYASVHNETQDYFTGKNHFDLFPHLENEKIFKNVVETGEPYFAYDKLFKHPTLKISYVNWSLQPIKDENNNVRSLILTLTDIIEHRYAEKTLQKSENGAILARKDWEQTFDAVPDLIAILNDKYEVVRVNRAMAEKFDLTPEECVGLTCYEVVHGTDEPPSFCPHQQLLEDGLEHVAEVHEDSLGGDFLVSTSPIHDEKGKLVGSVHVARDITQRKRNEAKKLELLEQTQNLAEDLEISNEKLRNTAKKLQTANEELWTTAEELQVSNEELQATTEELRVSNEELQDTTKELQITNEDLQQLNRILRALSNNNHAIIRAKDESEYLEAVCNIIVEDCGYSMVWIGYAENDEDKTVRPVAHAGFDEGYIETLNVTWADNERGRGPTGTAIRTGRITTCKNMLTDPKFKPWREAATERGYASSLVLPLEFGGNALGALSIYSREPDSFSDDEIKLLAELAKDLSLGIKTFRLRDAHEQSKEALLWNQQRNGLLADVASKLLTNENPQDIIDDLCQKTMEFLECDVFFNYLVDEQKGCLHLNACSGIPKEEAQKIEWLDYGAAVCGCVALEARRIIAENIFETPDPRTDLVESYGVQAYACHPLMVEGKSIGTLSFGTKSRITFTDKELDVMKSVADQISIAMNRLISNRALRESEQRMNRSQEIAHIGSWELDLVNNSLFWSDEVYRIFGLQPQEFDATYEAFLEAVHPDDRKAVDEAYSGSICEGRDTYEIEHRVVRKSTGEVRVVHEKCEHFRDESGEIIRSVGMVHDITRQKQAEKAVIRAKNDWEQTFDSVPDLIAILDNNYRVVRANKAMAEKLGMTSEECVGLACHDVVHGTNRPPSFCPHNQLLEDGLEHATEIHEDNLGGDYLVSASPLYDEKGKLIGSVHVARDISERKQAEEAIKREAFVASQTAKALIKSENEFRTLAENSPDVIARFDRQNRHLYVNPAAAEPYGISQEEIIGKTHSELGMDPEKIEFWERHHEQVFTTGKPETMEFQYKSPQGREYYFNTRIVPEFVDGEVHSIVAISRDITKIKEVEAKLKEAKDNLEEQVKERTSELEEAYEDLKKNEEQLRKQAELLNSTHDAIIVRNMDGKILYWNKGAEEMYGWTRREAFGNIAHQLLQTEFPESLDNIEAHVSVKGQWNGEFVRTKRDGTKIIVSSRWVLNRDKNGNPNSILTTDTDITDRKNAEEELRLASIYNRSLIEASLDPLVTIGPDGKITDVNGATESVTGYPRDDLVGTDFSDYFTEPEKARKGYQQVFREGWVLDYPLEIQHKKGHITPVLYNASVYENESGDVIGVFAAARDITERKKAEKELELASKYNRSLIEASLDPLVTIGPDGKVTDVNKATESVTGYSHDELIGTDFSDYFTEPEKARKGYQQVFREGQVFDYPLEIKHKDGYITPVLYNASVYRDDSGEVIGVFAAARDITKRKKAEKMLKLKLEELARSNAELEQFAYVSSHDLQEPLRMIGSYLQLLQRRYHGELDDKADKYIDFAVDGATRMQNLINDLLAFSRVTTQAKEFEAVDCELILNQVLSNLEVSINENEAVISHDLLPTVIADYTQLSQLFQNLISNAIKFRSDKTPEIYISAKKEDNQWLFSVADNGIGIDPKHSERIFEVFKRLHKRREYPGTGIGLSICKKIVERHGGHIWVESEPNSGSVFYFTLPVNS